MIFVLKKKYLFLESVNVITSDGRVILVRNCLKSVKPLGIKIIKLQGTLKGFDQTINLVLDDSIERVFTINGVEQVNLGVYIIRGDNV